MSELFEQLIKTYAEIDIEFPHLKGITLAQWMLESGRGTSRLASEHLNFGGLKWRKEMAPFATPVDYKASDGLDKYCKFDSLEKFIKGYWRFIDRSPYAGWRDNTNPAEKFIRYIARSYVGELNYISYASKILKLYPEAQQQLASVEHQGPSGAGTSDPFKKPPIKKFIQSPNYSSRDGAKIDTIIVHYTTTGNVQSTINHFLNPNPPSGPVSAHYIVDKNGDIYQMVKDSDKAWHAAHANRSSLGIEHVAKAGEQLTEEQEKSAIALIKWLMAEYKIPPENIKAHKQVGATDCPGNIFGDRVDDRNLPKFKEWVTKNFSSIAQSTNSAPITLSNNSPVSTNAIGASALELYIIKPGENLLQIARLHKLTLEELLALNPIIKDANLIFPGQIIKVVQIDRDEKFIDTV